MPAGRNAVVGLSMAYPILLTENNLIQKLKIGASVGLLLPPRPDENLIKQRKALGKDLEALVNNQNSTATFQGNQKELNLNFSDLLFEVGSDKINASLKGTIEAIGQKLANNSDLRIVVEGYTDNVGNDAYNKTLSEKRARSVAVLLAMSGVDPIIITTAGYGKERPIVPNTNEENRAKNRRVVLKVIMGR